jgi:serine/threonine-protein kinase
MGRVAAYIRDYRGGACFFLNPTAVSAQDALIEGYGVDPQAFAAFDTAFKDKLGFEAKIQVRQIERGQCPVVEALAEQARAKPASVPKLKLENDRIRSGGELRGTIDFGEARRLKLFLVEGDGQVHDLEPYVKRSSQQASFTVRLEKAVNEGWRSQLLVAVGSRESLALGGADRRSDGVFRTIAQEAARPDSGVGLAVRYVKVGS